MLEPSTRRPRGRRGKGIAIGVVAAALIVPGGAAATTGAPPSAAAFAALNPVTPLNAGDVRRSAAERHAVGALELPARHGDDRRAA